MNQENTTKWKTKTFSQDINDSIFIETMENNSKNENKNKENMKENMKKNKKKENM
jgi:hypothetical protein